MPIQPVLCRVRPFCIAVRKKNCDSGMRWSTNGDMGKWGLNQVQRSRDKYRGLRGRIVSRLSSEEMCILVEIYMKMVAVSNVKDRELQI